jgi:hypothetical protein
MRKQLAVAGYLVFLFAFAATAAHAATLTVTNVQVTQAIQTAGNTIPLVALRSTAVRATIGVTNSAVPVPNVTGSLHVFVNGSEVTPAAGIPPINAPFTAPLAPQLANQNDTLNFEVPSAIQIPASNNVGFRVDIVGGTSGSANNLTFTTRTTPLLYFTRINYTPAGLGLPALNLVQPGVGDAFVRGILPVNDRDPLLYRQGLFPTLPYSENAAHDGVLAALGSDGNDLLALLASCRQLIVNGNVGAADRIFLFGFLAGNPINGNGAAQVGGRNAFGNTQLSRYQRSYAHELTHNFGFNHNNDNIDQVGWDVTGRLINNPAGNNTPTRVKPTTLFDIQVPGLLTNQAWVETAKYTTLFNSATLANGPDSPDKLSRNVLVIQGIFDPAGRRLLRLKPVFRYPWASQPTRPLIQKEQQPLPFAVEVRGETGQVARVPFDARVADDPSRGPEHEVFGFFEVMVPFTGQVRSVRITDRTGKMTFGAIERSQTPPRIQILSPKPGELLGETVRVVWRARASTPVANLMFQAAYSPDNGRSFVPIGVDIRGNTLVFPTGQLQKSSSTGLIRVFVSDGLNTAWADVTGLSK